MDRYSCPAIAQLWTDEAKLRRWLVAWQAGLAAAGQPEGPLLELLAIPDFLPLLSGRARVLEAEYGHDVAATVEALREMTAWVNHPGETARWLHYGLCSSDITDTGLMLAINEAAAELAKLGYTVAASLPAREDDAVYRTHGQAAQVSRGDHRWYGLAQRLSHAVDMLRDSVPSVVGFNGPTGNGGSSDFDRQEALIVVQRHRPNITTRLSDSDGSQVRDRAEHVDWLQAVSRVATVCEQFGLTVRLLSQTGVDEVREGRPAGYRGSSSMPHKHNPSQSERLCGLAPVVRGLVSGYAEAAASCWDAHSLEHSSAERVVFPLVTELVGFMLTEVASIADSLEFSTGDIAQNVERFQNRGGDSFAAKNALVKSGSDGGTAWLAARPDVPLAAGETWAIVDAGRDPEVDYFPL